MQDKPLFREVQQFRQPWVWALLGGVALLMLALGPLAWSGLIVVGAVAGLLYGLRLETEVRPDGIYVKMWPLHRSARRIAWADVERCETTEYSPLREFGGWGIRWAPGKVAYNVRGNRGVWIERTNERDVLVGSQRPEALLEAIEEAVPSSTPE
ncbi:DUF6141 family protein [Halogeometricum luteum]|uniref:DUF6141 family protein n=1 Tax=Halogeometricum luteum TaxID=2950537 RepID=A0ABU2G466_9EURY|nr:DUF6141 family protein [Halogeometricum sp. S3BR5-2]MDS0294923.1 DUF6141 family protein [Halogeometricum sp. S3BR5-2]